MLHDAQTIRIDAGLQSKQTQSGISSVGQFFASLVERLQAGPSTTEIARQQKYQRLVNETQDSINANMPARVRRQMHYY